MCGKEKDCQKRGRVCPEKGSQLLLAEAHAAACLLQALGQLHANDDGPCSSRFAEKILMAGCAALRPLATQLQPAQKLCDGPSEPGRGTGVPAVARLAGVARRAEAEAGTCKVLQLGGVVEEQQPAVAGVPGHAAIDGPGDHGGIGCGGGVTGGAVFN